MQIQILLFVGFVAFALFYGISKRRKQAAALGPALRNFLERTGYRYAEILQAPLDQQAAHGEAVMRDTSKGFKVHMIRDFHGTLVHNQQSGQPTKTGWASSYSWSLPLAAPPRAVFQLADKSLAGIGKAVKEAFSNTRRMWAPEYPIKVPLADPELERRLVCYAESPEDAQHALATPGLKQLLLGCAEVDLTVTRDAITFSDPFGKNLNASVGGIVGQMAMGGDVGKMMELQITVHDRIAELMAVTSRAIV